MKKWQEKNLNSLWQPILYFIVSVQLDGRSTIDMTRYCDCWSHVLSIPVSAMQLSCLLRLPGPDSLLVTFRSLVVCWPWRVRLKLCVEESGRLERSDRRSKSLRVPLSVGHLTLVVKHCPRSLQSSALCLRVAVKLELYFLWQLSCGRRWSSWKTWR